MQNHSPSTPSEILRRHEPDALHGSWKLLCLLLFVAAALVMQYGNGAWGKDFSSHPDEAAHVVTGLMVRDYLLEGIPAGAAPRGFIQAYYDHLPKVALGHYPPAFYAVEGLWLTIFRTPQAAIVFTAVVAGMWAWLVWLCARRLLPGRVAPLIPACLVLLLPEVQQGYGMVMSDIFMSALCVASAMAFSNYLETGLRRWSLLFGLLAAAAALTKASGFLLALLPPVALLLTGNWRWIFRGSLWLAVLPVALTALPWTVATRGITQEGMIGTSLSQHVPVALRFYGWTLWHIFGTGLLALIIVALVRMTAGLLRGSRPGAMEACLWGLGAGCLGLNLAVPAGMETRYLLPLVPWVILGCAALRPGSTETGLREKKLALAGGVLAACFCMAERVRPQPVKATGYQLAADFMNARSPDMPGDVLISSDPPGEGALIAALAFDFTPAERSRVKALRGTKVLSTSDWMGRGYKLTYETPESLRDYLRSSGIRYILVDSAVPVRSRKQHQELLEKTVSTWPEIFPAIHTAPVLRQDGATGTVTLYSVSSQS